MDVLEMLKVATDNGEAQLAAAAATPEAETACARWNATELASHMIESLMFNAHLIAGSENTANPFDPPELEAASMVERYKDATASLVDAASAPGALERIVQHPAGEMPAAQSVMFTVFDQYVHGWDMEQATGLAGNYPSELTAAIEGLTRQFGTEDRTPDILGPVVEAPEGASDMEKLVAFLGRTP